MAHLTVGPCTDAEVIAVRPALAWAAVFITLGYLLRVLQQRKPLTLKIAALLDKPERRIKKDVKADYIGFQIPNEFVVGYGLDYAERYRNLKDVCVLSLPPS